MKRILAIAAVVAVLVVAAAVVWLNFLRADGPSEFDLTENTGAQNGSGEEITLDSLDGTWTIASGSEAGYRVIEDLRGVKDFEAVGRTEQVTGSITIAGTTVTEGSFEIDVASISSDSSQRDGVFGGDRVMDAATFPTATFTMTEAADFGSIPSSGESAASPVSGDLTLRDVTQAVTLDVEAQVVNAQIELVGSLDIVFADYGINNPSNAVATVGDQGTIEIKLLLAQS